MRKRMYLAMAVAVGLTACSSDKLVNEEVVRETQQVPIEFTVQKQNITRASQNLESIKHYNFGVWAWKINGKNSAADAEVMNHYLVGYSGSSVGYDHTNATTWAETAGTNEDHKSPWFYEGLGTAEYKSAAAGYYQPTDGTFMSAKANQYLRYWDLGYLNTNFYCYTPYNKGVTFDKASNTMTFPATGAIRDGYEEPLNSAYANFSRTLGEYMYAGVQATNAALADVTIPFKHMGAQLYIRFYEDIPGYRVELIDLCADNGKTSATGDMTKGIQATPAIAGATYTAGTYYTTSGATITFSANAEATTYAPSWDGSTKATNTAPLMFKIPQAGLSTAAEAPANLEDWENHKVIPQSTGSGEGQKFSYSPTVYYPVAQDANSTTGFTFHVSYRIIAEDNKEVITVHNAMVHVPYKANETLITPWQANVKYTYTFKITKNSKGGTTDPDTTIDPTNPDPGTVQSLYPIVFDAATIEDYTQEVSKEYIISPTN